MQARNADSSFVEGGVAEGFSLSSHLMRTNTKRHLTHVAAAFKNVFSGQLRERSAELFSFPTWSWEIVRYCYPRNDNLFFF